MAVDKNYIKRHRSWQKYAKKELAAGRKPKKFKDWKPELKKENQENVYFRGIKRESIESRLKRAGVNPSRFKRSKK